MKWLPHRSCRPGGEVASASVEFALVLPLVLVIGLALVQVGLLAKDQLVVVEAARAGAREATVTIDDGAVREAAIGASVGLAADRLSVSVLREGGVGMPVKVTVSYEAAPQLPLVGWLFPSSITLSNVAVMRQETEQGCGRRTGRRHGSTDPSWNRVPGRRRGRGRAERRDARTSRGP